MASDHASSAASGVAAEEVQAVLAACRVLVALSAQSISVVEDEVDLVQFRALVIVASRGSVSLSQLAEGARISLTKASRMCDRMASMNLLDRAADPTNRRQLNLTLTAKGSRLVRKVIQRRHAAIEPILGRMTRQDRAALVSALHRFAAAGDEFADPDLWALGWTS